MMLMLLLLLLLLLLLPVMFRYYDVTELQTMVLM
jgi:hypothetical protein